VVYAAYRSDVLAEVPYGQVEELAKLAGMLEMAC
jgi:hypothetical protein